MLKPKEYYREKEVYRETAKKYLVSYSMDSTKRCVEETIEGENFTALEKSLLTIILNNDEILRLLHDRLTLAILFGDLNKIDSLGFYFMTTRYMSNFMITTRTSTSDVMKIADVFKDILFDIAKAEISNVEKLICEGGN